MRPASLITLESAGGVVYRPAGEGIEVILIKPLGARYWTLPKGIIDKGENHKTTAIREAREETGVEVEVAGKIGKSSYWYYHREMNSKCRKAVTYYLLEYVSGDVADHDAEVEDAKWVGLSEAAGMLTFRSDIEMLEKAGAMIIKLSQKKLAQEGQ